jgi:hypothetical protein
VSFGWLHLSLPCSGLRPTCFCESCSPPVRQVSVPDTVVGTFEMVLLPGVASLEGIASDPARPTSLPAYANPGPKGGCQSGKALTCRAKVTDAGLSGMTQSRISRRGQGPVFSCL